MQKEDHGLPGTPCQNPVGLHLSDKGVGLEENPKKSIELSASQAVLTKTYSERGREPNIPQRSSEPQATSRNAFCDSQRLSEGNSTKNPVAQPGALGDALYALVGPATVPLACQ